MVDFPLRLVRSGDKFYKMYIEVAAEFKLVHNSPKKYYFNNAEQNE